MCCEGADRGIWALAIQIPPRETRMLMNLPIPVGTVLPSSNGRSTLFRMRSSGPVYIANLAMFAPLNSDKTERVPTQTEWEALLVRSDVSGPRDIPPTPIQDLGSYARVVYGRVAGVAVWVAVASQPDSTVQPPATSRSRRRSYADFLRTQHAVSRGFRHGASAERQDLGPLPRHRSSGQRQLRNRVQLDFAFAQLNSAKPGRHSHSANSAQGRQEEGRVAVSEAFGQSDLLPGPRCG